MATNPGIDAVLKSISKQFGEGSARLLSDEDAVDILRVSSGSLNLDLALGGGFPSCGRTIELFGPEQGGKTTIALLHAVEQQKQNPTKYVVFIDLEHALNIKLAVEYGIDPNRFILCQPDTAEEGFDLAEAFIRSEVACLVIIDSVAAAVPKAEAEGSVGDQQMGLQARLMGKALRKLTSPADKYNCSVVFINQLREKVGFVMGNPETTPGGRALKFFASIRVSVRQGEKVTDPGNKDNIIGHIINTQVVKNKTAMPYKKASFTLLYGKGVDKISEVFDLALLAGYIQRGGAYYKIIGANGEPIERVTDTTEPVRLNIMGKDNFVNLMKADADLCGKLEKAIRTGIAPTEEEIKFEGQRFVEQGA